MNIEFTKDYLKKNIVVLKNNEVYRVGDMFKLSTYGKISNHKICKYVYENQKYDNSLMKLFLQKLIVPKLPNKHQIMLECVKYYKQNNDIPTYDDSILVVHLRSGDAYKTFGIGSNDIKNEIQKKIEEYIAKYKTIKKILIITALHYGHTNYPGLYCKNNVFPTKYSYKLSNHNDNIDAIYNFILEQKLPVSLRSCESIDEDFTILCTCKYLISCKGAFSQLIIKINSLFNN